MNSLPTALAAFLATTLLASSTYAQVTLSPSASVPSGASPTVNPAFCAYAFEERSFYYYASKYCVRVSHEYSGKTSDYWPPNEEDFEFSCHQ
jgi:hypothetical protein